MKKIILPKPYLSWSQLTLFENNPEQYKQQYIFGEKGFENDSMRYGKLLANALDGKEVEDELIKTIATLLPKYKTIEKKIEAETGGVKLLGYLDSYEPYKIYEYKTGMQKWTQARVKKHGQLYFYATLVYLKYKKIPTVKLVWAETEREDGEIVATGKIEEFTLVISLKDILKFMAKIQKVAKEISKMYQEEINKLI